MASLPHGRWTPRRSRPRRPSASPTLPPTLTLTLTPTLALAVALTLTLTLTLALYLTRQAAPRLCRPSRSPRAATRGAALLPSYHPSAQGPPHLTSLRTLPTTYHHPYQVRPAGGARQLLVLRCLLHMEIRPDDVPVRYLVITPAPHGGMAGRRCCTRCGYGSIVPPSPPPYAVITPPRCCTPWVACPSCEMRCG